MVLVFSDKCLVSPDAGLYHFINQGVLTVDGIDDVQEMKDCDVRTVVFYSRTSIIRTQCCADSIFSRFLHNLKAIYELTYYKTFDHENTICGSISRGFHPDDVTYINIIYVY